MGSKSSRAGRDTRSEWSLKRKSRGPRRQTHLDDGVVVAEVVAVKPDIVPTRLRREAARASEPAQKRPADRVTRGTDRVGTTDAADEEAAEGASSKTTGKTQPEKQTNRQAGESISTERARGRHKQSKQGKNAALNASMAAQLRGRGPCESEYESHRGQSGDRARGAWGRVELERVRRDDRACLCGLEEERSNRPIRVRIEGARNKQAGGWEQQASRAANGQRTASSGALSKDTKGRPFRRSNTKR